MRRVFGAANVGEVGENLVAVPASIWRSRSPGRKWFRSSMQFLRVWRQRSILPCVWGGMFVCHGANNTLLKLVFEAEELTGQLGDMPH